MPANSPANGLPLPARILHAMSDGDLDKPRTFSDGEVWTIRGWFESYGIEVTPVGLARSPAALAEHRPDAVVVARKVERVLQLEQRLRPERVAHLGPVDRDHSDSSLILDSNTPCVDG